MELWGRETVEQRASLRNSKAVELWSSEAAGHCTGTAWGDEVVEKCGKDATEYKAGGSETIGQEAGTQCGSEADW